MLELARNLDAAVHDFLTYIASVDTSDWNWKPRMDKWSKKEILGHMIDSAQNNIQRFIRGTYEEGFKIVYHQEEWVKAQHYNEASLTELLEMWKLLNHQIVRILRSYPSHRLEVTSDIGHQQPELVTIKQIGEGYIEHLLHHLLQIKQYKYA